jgi:Domain of unknown function (DUF4386)
MLHRPAEALRAAPLLVGPAEVCAERLAAFVAAGARRVFVWPLGDEVAQLELFHERVAALSVLVLRAGMLARWVGWAGLVASVLYLFNQGDILATAIPGFPVFDLAGFVGSSLWALWVIALGVAVLGRRPGDRSRSGAERAEAVGSPS